MSQAWLTTNREKLRWGYVLGFVAFIEVLLLGGTFGTHDPEPRAFRIVMVVLLVVGLPLGAFAARRWRWSHRARSGARSRSFSERLTIASATVAVTTVLTSLVLVPAMDASRGGERVIVAAVQTLVSIGAGYSLALLVNALRRPSDTAASHPSGTTNGSR
jgi:hypothetical protein